MFLRPQLHSRLIYQWLGCQFKPERGRDSVPPPLTYSGEHDMLVPPDVEAQARHLRERKAAEA